MASDHILWLTSLSDPFPALVFVKFLRLSEEHTHDPKLKDLESKICVQIWQQKCVECKSIGREFVRIYTSVRELPGLAAIKQDLLKDTSGPILRLILQERGNRSGERNPYISFILPIELQRKIEFMLSKVQEPLFDFYRNWMLKSASF